MLTIELLLFRFYELQSAIYSKENFEVIQIHLKNEIYF